MCARLRVHRLIVPQVGPVRLEARVLRRALDGGAARLLRVQEDEVGRLGMPSRSAVAIASAPVPYAGRLTSTQLVHGLA